MRFAIILLVSMVCATGCNHALEIKNLRSYENMAFNAVEKPVSVGMIPSTSDIDTKKIIKGVADQLGKYSATAVLPYFPQVGKPVDIIVNINVETEYHGSGWNFLINFPGFLIWTPAWHGYHYHVDYTVNLLLTDGATNQKIDDFKLPVKLSVRHADMNRTWTEVSWLEVGFIAFVGGIVFTGFDDDVAMLVADRVETPIGDYIAQEIVSRINAYRSGARLPAR